MGVDNRTCALRLVGHGNSLRIENRVPGGDVNPYLAARPAPSPAGLKGIDDELPAGGPVAFTGNAYASSRRHGSRRRCVTRSRCSRLYAWPRRPSATRSSTTTPTTPGWSWPPSTRRSIIGTQGGNRTELNLGALMKGTKRGQIIATTHLAGPPGRRKGAIVAAVQAQVWPLIESQELIRPVIRTKLRHVRRR